MNNLISAIALMFISSAAIALDFNSFDKNKNPEDFIGLLKEKGYKVNVISEQVDVFGMDFESSLSFEIMFKEDEKCVFELSKYNSFKEAKPGLLWNILGSATGGEAKSSGYFRMLIAGDGSCEDIWIILDS